MLLPLAWPFVATVLLPLVVIYGIALWGLSDHPHTHFGPANIITALRAAMVCLTASTFVWFEGLASAPTALWILIGFVLAALSLDVSMAIWRAAFASNRPMEPASTWRSMPS